MKHTCEKRVYDLKCTASSGHLHGVGAKYEYEGQWYCKTHHPPTIEAKVNAQSRKWNEEWEAKAAAEMLDSRWAKQTPERAEELAGIMRDAGRRAMTVCSECGFELHRSQGRDTMGRDVRHRHRSDIWKTGSNPPSARARRHSGKST